MKINVDFEGTFDSRDDAADALERVAEEVRDGKWRAQQPMDSHPSYFITSAGDSDD